MINKKTWLLNEAGTVKEYDDRALFKRFYLTSINILVFNAFMKKNNIIRNKKDVSKTYEMIKEYTLKHIGEKPFMLFTSYEGIIVILFESSDIDVNYILQLIEREIEKILGNDTNSNLWGKCTVSGLLNDENCLRKHILNAKRKTLLDMEDKIINGINYSLDEICTLIEKSRLILNDMLDEKYGALDYETILDMSEKMDELLIKYYRISE